MRGIKSHIHISVKSCVELRLINYLIMHNESGRARLSLDIWHNILDLLYSPLLIGLSIPMNSGVEVGIRQALRRQKNKNI